MRPAATATSILALLIGAQAQAQSKPEPPPVRVTPPPSIMIAPMPPPPPAPPTFYAPPAPPAPPAPIGPARARSVRPLYEYFSSDDYPAVALRSRAEGRTGFRLVIGPNGRVTECIVTSSSGSAVLDAATCRIIQARARYYPARDAQGRPAVGSDHGRVTWLLPAPLEMPPPDVRLTFPTLPRRARPPVADVPLAYLFDSATYPDEMNGRTAPPPTTVSFVVDRGGAITGCAVTRSNGHRDLEAPVCRTLVAGLHFEPARDARARRIAVRAELVIAWRAPETDRTPVPASPLGPQPIPAPPPPPIRDAVRALPNLSSYFSADDYPPAALRNNEEGTVEFRLVVGPDGRVFQCAVTRSSGSALLDATTCEILIRRARFSPARDRQGRPTTDTVNSRVRWVLPSTPPKTVDQSAPAGAGPSP